MLEWRQGGREKNRAEAGKGPVDDVDRPPSTTTKRVKNLSESAVTFGPEGGYTLVDTGSLLFAQSMNVPLIYALLLELQQTSCEETVRAVRQALVQHRGSLPVKMLAGATTREAAGLPLVSVSTVLIGEKRPRPAYRNAGPSCLAAARCRARCDPAACRRRPLYPASETGGPYPARPQQPAGANAASRGPPPRPLKRVVGHASAPASSPTPTPLPPHHGPDYRPSTFTPL